MAAERALASKYHVDRWNQQFRCRGRRLILTIKQQVDCSLLAIGLVPRGKDLWYQKGTIAAVNIGIEHLSCELGFIAAFANEGLLRHGGAEGARLYYTDRAHLNREGYLIVTASIETTLATASMHSSAQIMNQPR